MEGSKGWIMIALLGTIATVELLRFLGVRSFFSGGAPKVA